MNNTTNHNPRKILLPIGLLILIGLVVIILDREKIIPVITQAQWTDIVWALFFASLSYLFISLSYTILARSMGIHMPRAALSQTFFVTAVMNHVIRSGGIAGFSVRAMIMKQHGVSVDDTLSSSLIHLYLASLDMELMLPIGVAYIFVKVDPTPGISYLLLGLVILCTIFSAGATFLIFSPRLRNFLAGLAQNLVMKLARRDVSSSLAEFNRHMTLGTDVFGKHPNEALLVIGLIFADWLCSMFALSFCLSAFGPPLPIGAVIAIFVIGIMAGVLAWLPGGIGVQEGAMAGLGVLLGATFEQTILAALLFRVVYYFLPYLISPWFYVRLLRPQAIQTDN